jgi:hypothetical protein
MTGSLLLIASTLFAEAIAFRQPVSQIRAQWDNIIQESTPTTTLQVVVNPMLGADSPIRNTALDSLRAVANNYVRFVPWFPYPKLSVPEINAPVINSSGCFTSWDFSYADQFVEDFFKSTPGVSHIINFSTTPDWMWILDSPYTYPADASEADFNYNNGTQLRDPTFKEVSDYYARLVSWYVNGGFNDECGEYHHSGHDYDIEYWEVLNEVDFEHDIQPAYYNQIYDAIVTAIQKVSPGTKFVGLALGTRNTTYFKEFLDPSKHAPNIPLDFISYHFYGEPANASTGVDSFQQADTFLLEVAQIESIRKQLSPNVRTTLDEVGTIDPMAGTTIYPGYTDPDEYWVWSGGLYAYVFSQVATMGIDVIGESQLVGYPSQYPSVSMVNWTTGEPNARLRVLQLLEHDFAPSDHVIQTNQTSETQVHAQAFLSTSGQRKVLLVNKQAQGVTVRIEDFDDGVADIVDLTTGPNKFRTETIKGTDVDVPGWATVVVKSTRYL